MMKKITLFLTAILLALATQAQNGLEKIIVEKYYVSDAADSIGSIGILPVGSVTYRVYADMLPGYKFQALYGINSPVHELKIATTTSFFNNEDRGATTPSFTKTQARNNTVMLDSWFSVGGTCGGQVGVLKTEDTDGSVGNANNLLQNTDASAGIPLTTQDGMITGTPETVTFVGFTTELDVFDATSQYGSSFSTTNGSVASLNGSVGPTSENRVLVGQFTTDGVFSFELNVQIGTPTGGVENYVARDAEGSEIYEPTLTFKSDSTVGISKQVSATNKIQLYPNPANDVLNISVQPPVKQLSYSIYSFDGRQILENEFTTQGNNINKINLSAFAPGIYFLETNIDGAITTSKFIKQ